MSALSVEVGNALLDSGQDDIPEFRGADVVVLTDILHSIADLEVRKIVSILVEYVCVVRAVVAYLHGRIDFVEDVVWHIWVVVVTTGVHFVWAAFS